MSKAHSLLKVLFVIKSHKDHYIRKKIFNVFVSLLLFDAVIQSTVH